jgi:hypothetical protein
LTATRDKKVETIWSAQVAPVAQLEALDMNAPLSGSAAARARAAALRDKLSHARVRAAKRPSADTLRKLVR